jgi:hypothetical protein
MSFMELLRDGYDVKEMNVRKCLKSQDVDMERGEGGMLK